MKSAENVNVINFLLIRALVCTTPESRVYAEASRSPLGLGIRDLRF
jgi:hypothetical protein